MRASQRGVFGFVLGLGIVGGTCAAERPDNSMMVPIQALVHFMSSPPASPISGVFAKKGVVIVENFAPYIFIGPGAVSGWETGFRGHFLNDKLSDLEVTFGEPQDFGRDGNRAYFALPTAWTGRSQTKRFKEDGVWSFVLVRTSNAWRVLGYAWGVKEVALVP